MTTYLKTAYGSIGMPYDSPADFQVNLHPRDRAEVYCVRAGHSPVVIYTDTHTGALHMAHVLPDMVREAMRGGWDVDVEDIAAETAAKANQADHAISLLRRDVDRYARQVSAVLDLTAADHSTHSGEEIRAVLHAAYRGETP